MKPSRTRSQEKVLQELSHLGRAISAQALYTELRSKSQTIGLATVYRSLEALKLNGVVQARLLPTGETLYSLVKEDRHHLTCLQCGDSIPIEACPVRELESQLRQSKQFEIYYHTLEFFGLCSGCQLKASKEKEEA
jgi:Fur family transcriptional regulator, ferric uptake regulator